MKKIKKQNNYVPKILPPSDDIVFKMLFGDERNKSLLVGLLSSFLELPDEEYDIIFTDPHLKPETKDDKLGILDVRIKTKTGKIINIEIQVDVYVNIGERISFYKSKLIQEQIGWGQHYDIIKKVICVCILEYVLFPRVKDYINGFKFTNPKNRLEFDQIPEEVYTIELPKVPEQSDGSALWEWLQFLKSREKEEFEMIAAKNPLIRKAVNTLYRLSLSKEARRRYDDRREIWAHDQTTRLAQWKAEGIAEGKAEGYAKGEAEGRAEGKAEGRAEGKAEGRAEGKAEVAQNLKKMGLSINQIAEVTGLSVEVIEQL
jgi:predicted transposase/invertase (TIGR01784 family)